EPPESPQPMQAQQPSQAQHNHSSTQMSAAVPRRRRSRRLSRAVMPGAAIIAAAALVLTGCSSDSDDGQEAAAGTSATTGAQSSDAQSAETGGPTRTMGVFADPAEATNAFTYDTDDVPVGSKAWVTVDEHDSKTSVTLKVAGLLPDHDYGAHAHQKACGMAPSDSGPHYQNVPDPQATSDDPSSDPQYANPDNEVWMDFTPDIDGEAQVSTTQ